MEELLLDILRALRAGGLDATALKRLIDHRNHLAGGPERAFSKRRLLPFYLRVKSEEPERWRSWRVTSAEETQLVQLLRMKPHRTASGVATITVITKPWPCSSDCLYCPSDVRMPKSYLHDEPACRRAERCWFDPYLQVVTRLRALVEMGHPCDKIELIVLGGTWTDYPRGYQVWFAKELFRALNDGIAAWGGEYERRKLVYRQAGISDDRDEIEARVRGEQGRVDAGEESFAAAISKLYGYGLSGDGGDVGHVGWAQVSAGQTATRAELFAEQRRNESAEHRVVGLVVETRPDCIDVPTLLRLRELGCTKVQIGVQSLQQEVLDANRRAIGVAQIQEAFECLRLFGFKIHAHFMVNLYGTSKERDLVDYRALMEDERFMPDEVKLYPCALIGGTGLVARYRDGSWRPYDEGTLVSVLAQDVRATPPFCRVSRMIRDFSSGDVVAGNKKTNLRQLVEARLRDEGARVEEMRFREIRLEHVDFDRLKLDEYRYETTLTEERFLQWVTPENELAGFLRLSLPEWDRVPRELARALPVGAGEAMIREVHVYGSAARLGRTGTGAQHLGLGRRLVERACEIARNAGFKRLNVISAVGTREYYRGLGFSDNGLYQTRPL